MRERLEWGVRSAHDVILGLDPRSRPSGAASRVDAHGGWGDTSETARVLRLILGSSPSNCVVCQALKGVLSLTAALMATSNCRAMAMMASLAGLPLSRRA